MRYRLPILLMLKDQSKEPLLDISYQAKMLSLVKRDCQEQILNCFIRCMMKMFKKSLL